MLTPEDNQLLTHIEGDAPMGRLIRQKHWIPAMRSGAVEADGAPVGVRLFGKDYAVFRATDGRVGFIDEKCPHRGVSMLLARNESSTASKFMSVAKRFKRPRNLATKMPI